MPHLPSLPPRRASLVCPAVPSRLIRALRCLPIALGLAFVASACGGGEETTTGIASLEDVASAEGIDAEPDADSTGEDAGVVSADEAALDLSACIRDAGFDIPDIGIDADGNPDIRSATESGNFDFRDQGFRDAMQACSGTVEGVTFGGGRDRAGLAENPEIQDAAIAFSDCIRAEGFDVGDLTLGQGPAGQADGDAADGEAPAAGQRGQGQGQGGFGDPSDRFAVQLGLDPEDPSVMDALETCGPIIEEVFSTAGVGQPEQN